MYSELIKYIEKNLFGQYSALLVGAILLGYSELLNLSTIQVSELNIVHTIFQSVLVGFAPTYFIFVAALIAGLLLQILSRKNSNKVGEFALEITIFFTVFIASLNAISYFY